MLLRAAAPARAAGARLARAGLLARRRAALAATAAFSGALPPPPTGPYNASTSSSSAKPPAGDNVTLALYATALAVAVAGMSYAAVPLYKVFCQATGYGGTTQKATEEAFRAVRPVAGARPITVHFNADTSAAMPWEFRPQQRSARVVPGETALAFYTAYNPSDRAVTGVSTYNVTPMKAGVYFNKIQCFCFEEQRLRPHEEIDMPVFFYIDPKFLDDPAMDGVRSLTLSYTFFPSGAPEIEAAAAALGRGEAGLGKPDDGASAKVREWTRQVGEQAGLRVGGQ